MRYATRVQFVAPGDFRTIASISAVEAERYVRDGHAKVSLTDKRRKLVLKIELLPQGEPEKRTASLGANSTRLHREAHWSGGEVIDLQGRQVTTRPAVTFELKPVAVNLERYGHKQAWQTVLTGGKR